MNNINLLNNSISQTDTQSAQPTQANAADSSVARGDTVSAVALAQIADANTPSSAPPESARPSSPAPCLSNPQTLLERFEKKLHQWREKKCGTQEYGKRIQTEEKMSECFKTSTHCLALSCMNLTSLPDEIGALTSLRIINLYNNQLTALPDAFSSLTGLQKLSLAGNQLTSFPVAIVSLTDLRELSLSGNCLTSLSLEVGSLRGLRELDLLFNRLTSIPDTISSLTSLQKLDLSWNRLTTLPIAIGSMMGLQTLKLSCNALRSLPDSIGSLTSLHSLCLSDNELTSLPGSILTLSRDCIVDVSNTALSERVLTYLSEEIARALYQGPRFYYSMPVLTAPQERSLTVMIPELYRVIDRPSPAFPNLEAIDESHHLRSWLNRLSCTATYQRGGDAQGQFVSHIVRYLEEAEENETFRSILMPILEEASQTCGDRVALSILHVGVQHRLHHFDLSDPKGLSQFLIHGPMTLSILEQYARELVPTFRFVDEIEVYLGLPIMLKDRLSIPIDISEMLYFQCSNLTEAHLEVAVTRVVAEIDDLETRYQFLIEQSKWIEALEKCFPSEMAAFRKEYAQKLESGADPLPVRAEYEGHLKMLTNRLLQ